MVSPLVVSNTRDPLPLGRSIREEHSPVQVFLIWYLLKPEDSGVISQASDSSTVRIGFEPIGRFAGALRDPFNALEPKTAMYHLLPLLR